MPRLAATMRRHWAPALLCLTVLKAPAAPLDFDFAPGGNAHDHPAYDPQRGFGFEPGSAARFSVQLPEGNYRVTVRVGGTVAGATTLLAEQRRLLLEEVRTAKRKSVERSV